MSQTLAPEDVYIDDDDDKVPHNLADEEAQQQKASRAATSSSNKQSSSKKASSSSSSSTWRSNLTQERILGLITGLTMVVAAIVGLTMINNNDDNNNNVQNKPAPEVEGEQPSPPVDAEAIAIDTPDGQVLMLTQSINTDEETVTVQLDYEGLGWLAFGFSETGQMVPGVAVIGLPDDGTVLKYELSLKSADGVVPLPEDQQTLKNASIEQTDTNTILTFTKPLAENNSDEPEVIVGDNLFIWALGSSNELAYHGRTNRGSATETFVEEGAAPPVEKLECATQSTFAIPTEAGQVINLDRRINDADQTVTVQMEYEGVGWMAFGFSETGKMVPGMVVIGLPEEGTVLKYELSAYSEAGVVPLPNDQQTLKEATISQTDTSTVLTFTKPLVEEGEPTVTDGDENQFIWAVGGSNELAYHGPTNRGSATTVFDQCLEEVAPPPVAAPVDTPPAATKAPTVAPTITVTASPTVPPTLAPVTLAPVTAAPVAVGEMTGTFSKRGNRQSCSIDYCPSDGFQAQVTGNGCTCDSGLNSCIWDGQPTTVETFEEVQLVATNFENIFLLQGAGSQLNLGEGGDDASGFDCFDDPLRGGFRVDLSPTNFQITIESTVTVSGFSPAMRVIADGVNVGEVREYGAQGELSVEVPEGTRDLQVSCGGWPADCTSTLFVAQWQQ